MLFNNNGIHNFYVHFVLCRLPLAAAIYPVDTGRTLNVYKTVRSIYVLYLLGSKMVLSIHMLFSTPAMYLI